MTDVPREAQSSAPASSWPEPPHDVDMLTNSLLPELIDQIRRIHRIDLSAYRPHALRVQLTSRMAVLGITSYAEYADLLYIKTAEFRALLDVLLVGSTSFFRDDETFDVLRQRALDGGLFSSDSPAIRVWVPGCSSGEEAYSLAMMLTEVMETRGDKRPLRIFATDVRPSAVARTRAGLYSLANASRISAERLARFCSREEGGFRVRPELREKLICGPHDLLADPPFSRLDLVSCRNVLLYLEPPAQRFVLERLHYGLSPHGVLMLGGAESTNAADVLFRTLDSRHRLFARSFGRLSAPGRNETWTKRQASSGREGPPR